MEILHSFLNVPVDFTMDFIIPFLAVLTILVFVHEWGHFIVARLCGVRVEVFSIGFGREIFGFNDKKGTRWKFSLLPLGGYVKMYGDNDPSSMSVDEETRVKMTAADKKVAFYSKPVWQRAAIVFAGPAINFLFAIVLLAGLYGTMGQPYTPAVVGGIVEGGAADVAGLQPDDRVIAINGTSIRSFQDIQQATALNLDSEMELIVLRGQGDAEREVAFTLVPERIVNEDRFGFKHSTGRIGIISVEGHELATYGVGEAVVEAVKETGQITWDTLEAVGQIVTGTRGAEELGGVIRIGAMAGEFAKLGLISYITFAALLSINLGLINLFPIPMLDGGHLMFYAVEAIKGKPMSERAQEYFFRFGFACVMALMIFATWNDLVQLRVIEYFKGII